MGPVNPQISIPFVLAALLSVILAATAWRRVRTPASLWFAMSMVSVAVWVLATAMEVSVPQAVEKLLWAKIAFLGIASISTCWLLFVLSFVDPGERFSQWLPLWLSIIPVITIILAVTNERHGFIWPGVDSITQGGVLSLVYSHGIWFWFFTIYSYTLLVASAIFLIRSLGRSPRNQRAQIIGLLVGMALPWSGNILYLSGMSSFPGLDLTPFGLALTGLIFSWILFRQRLFDLAPLVYEAILENINDGFIALDLNGRVVEANGASCRLLKIDPKKTVGEPVSSVLHSWPVLIRLMRADAGTQVEVNQSNGEPLYLEATVNDWLNRDGEPAGRLLLLHDITRRRQAEEGLRASERLYRLLVNNAPIGITLSDPEGFITYASPHFSELYQLKDGETAVGHSPLQWIHPDYRTTAIKRMLNALENQETPPPQVYQLLRSDGSSFWGEVSSAPIIDEQGNSRGLLETTSDISQRKLLELRLQRNLERQTFINGLLQVLHRPHDLSAALGMVLERIGNFLKASRVYLCQDSTEGLDTTITLEWCEEMIRPRAKESPLVRYASIPSWQKRMEDKGQVIIIESDEPAEDLDNFLGTWNARSIAAFPIYGSEELSYGFLAVDHCDQPLMWDDELLELMGVVSRIVSGAVAQIQIETAERRQRSLAEALHDTASAMNRILSVDEVLDHILINLERVVKTVAANIALVDGDRHTRVVRWRGYGPDADVYFHNLQARVEDDAVYREMLASGKPVIIDDTWADKRWNRNEILAWVGSYAALPIRIKGKVEGFINIHSGETDFFTHDLANSLSVFADQAAVAIENARLYDATHRRAEELSILNRIGLTLTAGLDTEQVLYTLYDECRKVLPIDVFYVALYDAAAGRIEMPLYFNEGQILSLPPRDITQEPGLTGYVIQHRRTVSLPDILDPETEQTYGIIRLGGVPARSYVGVPLILLDQVVGVISVQSYNAHAYSPDQTRLLETIATQAAIAVQNARLYDQMKQMAITDSVTGLFTRRHLTTLGRSELERAMRYKRRLSVLMVDIDHFKRVNDTFGHNIGDSVLQSVAQICCQALRVTDIVGRWGGEEFAIVLPEADRGGAALIAERIRRMMSEAKIIVGEETLHVTVSIGVATLSANCSTLELLIDTADRALYMAKQAGRNQVQLLE